ncbi:hypothetical protein [Rubellicoccus peritrichatus]|uniref:Tyrosine kinase G-rich domain-containing protein n=1 Tax=Rubellicoccus peritrichatus TaxID=3080537 RepID=A0AAQ3QWN4_9BACT|nr:hypothetical protein [Puniceicoccus sp. CR14]WOO42030.1 hypothetical protein RZN69_02945 [Puniceicoccus sp. CR14]
MKNQEESVRDSSSHSSVADTASFGFFLPFDPLRYLYGLLARIYWPILLGIILAAIGFTVGKNIQTTHFSVSLPLLKRPVTSTIKTAEVGDSFRPREMHDSTLEATLLANEVLAGAMARAGKMGSGGLQNIKSDFQVEQMDGTDFFYITAHTDESPEAALELVQAWAEEIQVYSERLQRQEAMAISRLLSREVAELRRQLEQMNKDLLAFSEEQGYYDGDKQLDAVLRSRGELELQYQNTKIELSSRTEQIARLSKELRSQSPISEQLKSGREEVALLRGRYTDENPLVKEKLYEIEFLERKLSEVSDLPKQSLQQYTGTPLGNQLYLEILQLQNQRLELEKRVVEYERLLEVRNAEIDKLPVQMLHYADLLQRRDNLRQAYSLLNSRLQEAEIFSSSAQGYWEVFQLPGVEDIVVDTEAKKTLALAVLGLMAGVAIGLLLSFLLEFRKPRRRTALECAIAGEAEVLVALPEGNNEEWSKELRELWLLSISKLRREGCLILVSTSSIKADREILFWKGLKHIITKDNRKLLVFNIGEDAVPSEFADSVPMERLSPESGWSEKLRDADKEHVVMLRLGSMPGERLHDILDEVGFWFYLTEASADQITVLHEHRRVLASLLHPADGVAVVTAPCSSAIARTCESLGVWLSRRKKRLAGSYAGDVE